jgi:PAS domain S-box-containing protein
MKDQHENRKSGKSKQKSINATYGFTLLAVFCAFLTRWLFDPFIHDNAPFATFYVAVAVAAWLGGLRPAVLATILGYILAWYFFVPERYTFWSKGSESSFGLLLHLCVAIAILIFGEAMHRARNVALDSELRFQAIFNSTFQFTGLLETDGRMLEMNQAALNAIGIPASAATGLNLWDSAFWTHYPNDRQRVRDGIRSAAAGEFVRFEAKYRPKDGSEATMDFSITPVRDESGKVVLLVPEGRDITLMKEAEDRANLAADVAGLGVVRIDYASDTATPDITAAALFDLEPGVAVQRSELYSRLNPDKRDEVMNQLHEGLNPEGDGTFAMQVGVVHRDGSMRWLSVKQQVVFDNKVPITAVLAAVDVTERAKAMEALQASEQRVLLASESTSVGIWEWNIRTNAIRWDAQMFRIYGVPPTDDGFVTYDTWVNALMPADLEHHEASLRDTVERQGQSTREFRILRGGDGEIRTIQGVEAVRPNPGGKAEWVVGTNLDISDRKRVEEELRRLAAEQSEADRRKDEFLATLAHELRNPLAPIRYGLQIMRLSNNEGESVEQARTMMERQIGQMVHLVDDLLDVSRISQGKLKLRREQINLMTVLTNAVETWRSLNGASGHDLMVKMPEDSVFVDADATRLEQVFSNILNNAVKYSEPGSHIRLSVNRSNNAVLVSIKDSGVGIPPEMLASVFDMFTQVDRTLEKTQGGLGIGLCLVKRLVEMHEGSVEAFSEGIGMGSEFVVSLPELLDLDHISESSTGEDNIAKPTVPRRIMVVDDNHDSADTLSMMLTMMGNEVRTANDGLEAVKLAEEFRPDVVMLDIGMPKLNGYEACRRIREQPWTKDVVFLAMTGWGQDEDRRRSQEAGFDHHIVKPVDFVVLEKLLGRLEPTPK